MRRSQFTIRREEKRAAGSEEVGRRLPLRCDRHRSRNRRWRRPLATPLRLQFCRKHGNLYVSAHSGRLTITLAEPDCVSRYAFGHRTATFLICGRCGVVAAALSEIDGRLYAVLNANMLSPPLAIDKQTVPIADYEAENVPERLERRKLRWIGNVTVVGA